MRLFLISSEIFAVLGVLDALLWQGVGQTLYGQLFSLAELLWGALSLFALYVAWQQEWPKAPALSFIVYQLMLWGSGVVLHTNAVEQGGEFMPPDWMLLAALLFYGGYFILCHHYLSKEK